MTKTTTRHRPSHPPQRRVQAATRPQTRSPGWAQSASRIWSAPLWVHGAVLITLLLVAAPIMRATEVAWVDDEAYYGLQVEALDRGPWDSPYAGAEFDPDGTWDPVYRAEKTTEGRFPYAKHPVYIVILHGAGRVVGSELALLLMPVVSLVLAALAAWLLAVRLDRPAARPAFWLVATSPLVVDAYLLWAHTLSAAVAGFALLAAVRIVGGDRRLRWAVVLAALLALGALLRSEGVLFGLAVVVAILVTLLMQRRVREGLRIAGASALALGAAVVGEQWAVSQIVGRDSDALGTRAETPVTSGLEFLGERLGAAWHLVLSGGTPNGSGEFRTQLLPALALVVVAALLLRLQGREARLLGLGAGAAAIVTAVFIYGDRFAGLAGGTVAASGFFAAWPVALAGLVVTPWRTAGREERTLIGIAALFAAGVLATQYPEGGGGEWGGRFLSPAVVAIATVVALGLVRRLAERPWRQGALATVCLGLLAAVPAAQGLDVVRTGREQQARFIADVVAPSSPVIVVNAIRLASVPVWAWPHHRDADWYFALDDGVNDLVRELFENGEQVVTVVRSPSAEPLRSPYQHVEDVTGPVLQAHRWQSLRLSRDR